MKDLQSIHYQTLIKIIVAEYGIGTTIRLLEIKDAEVKMVDDEIKSMLFKKKFKLEIDQFIDKSLEDVTDDMLFNKAEIRLLMKALVDGAIEGVTQGLPRLLEELQKTKPNNPLIKEDV